ncbi:DUF2262 domain-containing protein [Blastopirellula marina]|uniref:DUF2262 domain-containing protein n=1 Tax=Blastopirellula marina TaxID=124 RepID=A0A2S8GTS1_9BACT|nr:DUF2262 domain-containing protein [Blastopirellula marina]PQO47825.1 hypothetical protein C5Y93_01935 [Blastopirellula marina]
MTTPQHSLIFPIHAASQEEFEQGLPQLRKALSEFRLENLEINYVESPSLIQFVLDHSADWPEGQLPRDVHQRISELVETTYPRKDWQATDADDLEECSFEDPFFGEFSLDEFDFWEAYYDLKPDQELNVRIEDQGDESLDPLLQRARSYFDNLPQAELARRQEAVRNGIIKTYNENWSDGKTLSEDEVLAHLQWCGIQVERDYTTLDYNVWPDLFCDHTIQIIHDEQGRFHSSNLVG